MDDVKFGKLADDIVELKVSVAKQEVNLTNQNKTLDRLTDSVELHIRRTAALEDMVELVRSEIDAKIESEIKPIKTHVHFVKGAIWAAGIVITALGALYKSGVLHKFFN